MSNNDPNPSSLDTEPTHERTSRASGPSNIPFTFSSWEDELRRDESDTVAADDASVMTYSYYSTWSSNYTMSNLEGTGRIIGNLYSKAGAALERRLWRLANRAALKAAAEVVEEARRAETGAAAIVRSGIVLGEDLSENEKTCDAILIYAQYVFLSFRRP